MLIAPCPASLLKDARTRLGLTQQDLAEQTRIDRWRISHFERGIGVPDPGEQRALCPVLELCSSALAHAAPAGPRPRLADERKGLAPRTPYRMPRDRPSSVRYRAAWKAYPTFLRGLERQLQDREDSEWIRVYLREAVFDSGLEMMASLQLLGDGAKPGWVSPQTAGFSQLPIVDPKTREVTGHHPYPTLAWEGCLLFPQVSLRARHLLTPDLLVGARTSKGVKWVDVEIDGRGHDPKFDDVRAQELDLPVVRFETKRVLDGSFLCELRELVT